MCVQIYMYCVWNGWIIQLVLFISVIKLTLNYLYIRYIHNTVCHTICTVFDTQSVRSLFIYRSVKYLFQVGNGFSLLHVSANLTPGTYSATTKRQVVIVPLFSHYELYIYAVV